MLESILGIIAISIACALWLTWWGEILGICIGFLLAVMISSSNNLEAGVVLILGLSILGGILGKKIKDNMRCGRLSQVTSDEDLKKIWEDKSVIWFYGDYVLNALNTALAEGRRQSFDVLFNCPAFDEKARKEWLTAVQDRASLTRLLEWMPGLMQEHLADVIKTGNTARAALLAECGISPAAAVLKNAPAEMRAVFLDEPVKKALQNKDLAYLKTVRGSGYTFSAEEKAQVFALALAQKDDAYAQSLIDEGLDISAQTCLPAITIAVLSKNTESLRRALAGGGSPSQEWHGQSLLEYALRKGWIEGAKLLLAALKDIDSPLKSGAYPIHLAVASENLEMVQGLIKRKAKLNIKDGKGRSPLAIAVELHLVDIGMALINAGGKP